MSLTARWRRPRPGPSSRPGSPSKRKPPRRLRRVTLILFFVVAAFFATFTASKIGTIGIQERILQQASALGWQQTLASVAGLGLAGGVAGNFSEAPRRRDDENSTFLSDDGESTAAAEQQARAEPQAQAQAQPGQATSAAVAAGQGSESGQAAAAVVAEQQTQVGAADATGGAGQEAQVAGATGGAGQEAQVAGATGGAGQEAQVAGATGGAGQEAQVAGATGGAGQEAQTASAAQGTQSGATTDAASATDAVSAVGAASVTDAASARDAAAAGASSATVSSAAAGGSSDDATAVDPSDVVTAAEAAAAQAAAAEAAAATAASDVAVGGEDESGEISAADQAAAVTAAAAAGEETSLDAVDEISKKDGEGKPDDWWVPGTGATKIDFDLSNPVHASKVIDELLTVEEPPLEYPEKCSIYVLDAAAEIWPKLGVAATCDLSDPELWPFAQPGRGIEGADSLPPQDSQYSTEYWISRAVRNSSRLSTDASTADISFVDLWCPHLAWLAWFHPFGGPKVGFPEPGHLIRRTLSTLVAMPRFAESRGSAFALVEPNPGAAGLTSADERCDELAGPFHLVSEADSLCQWSHEEANMPGRGLVLPYVASTDLPVRTPAELLAVQRPLLVYFRGGCGDPSNRDMFGAGKMMRYELVQQLKRDAAASAQAAESRGRGARRALRQDPGSAQEREAAAWHRGLFEAGEDVDILAECSCDICEGHTSHLNVVSTMAAASFCPIVSSNVQSSRRLSEAFLAGCIPVFLGSPWHALPLASHVDYARAAVFVEIEDDSAWIDSTQLRWQAGPEVKEAWSLPEALHKSIVRLPSLSHLVPYLRSIPEADVRAKRAAVAEDALKFYYPPAPAWAKLPGDGYGGTTGSVLGDLVVRELCLASARSKRVQESTRRAAELEAAQEAALAATVEPAVAAGAATVEPSAATAATTEPVAAAAAATTEPVAAAAAATTEPIAAAVAATTEPVAAAAAATTKPVAAAAAANQAAGALLADDASAEVAAEQVAAAETAAAQATAAAQEASAQAAIATQEAAAAQAVAAAHEAHATDVSRDASAVQGATSQGVTAAGDAAVAQAAAAEAAAHETAAAQAAAAAAAQDAAVAAQGAAEAVVAQSGI